jgi:hypothetical protein
MIKRRDKTFPYCAKKIRANWRMLLILGVLFFSFNTHANNDLAMDKNRASRLIQQAEQALANNRLTTPPKDNALDYLTQALAISPRHPDAEARLIQITQRYAQLLLQILEHSRLVYQKGMNQQAYAMIDRYQLPHQQLQPLEGCSHELMYALASHSILTYFPPKLFPSV